MNEGLHLILSLKQAGATVIPLNPQLEEALAAQQKQ
jgi:hypothetical protein